VAAALALLFPSHTLAERSDWVLDPFEMWRPASSAVGMYQITDATFAEAKRYCIRDHAVIEEGCWFNSLYTRTLPSHSSEMTAAYLHHSVVNALAVRPTAKVTLPQKQKLAAVIHLCGLNRGKTFVTRGFRVAPGERCGTHSLQQYLTKIDLMRKRFARLKESN